MDLEGYLSAVRRQARDATRLARSLRLPHDHRVLNVHAYGLASYEAFVRRYYGDGERRVVALSMNPGPHGAVQTGIPFCDAGMARQILADFDALVRKRPAWARSERTEMSGRKLALWADGRFGGLAGLYRRVLLAMTVPIAILRGPRLLNVPLPALPASEAAKVDAFLARHAADEIRLADPVGVLLLGQYASHVWEIATRADPSLCRLPSAMVPHPAARMGNADKLAAWSAGFARVSRGSV